MTVPVIQLEDFHKTYVSGEVEVHAVRGVTLTVQPGEFVAIMGASGSGKSTMMNTLGCLDRPTSGQFLLDGVNVGELNRDELADLRNQKIGFVFQGFNLLARTTALENVELPMLYCRPSVSSRNQRERGEKALALVGLADRADHTPSRLSGPCRPHAQPAFRRPTAARRHRPRAGQWAQTAPGGRADRQSRFPNEH